MSLYSQIVFIIFYPTVENPIARLADYAGCLAQLKTPHLHGVKKTLSSDPLHSDVQSPHNSGQFCSFIATVVLSDLETSSGKPREPR